MVAFKIENLIPKFIYDDSTGYAMSKAVESGLNYMCSRIREGVDLIDEKDTMPEWRLNEYAWEYGALWYDSTADIESKRNQVKSIRSVYERLGTKDAVVRAANSLFDCGTYVSEWFEYNGQPFHYTINVTNEDAIEAKQAEMLRLIGIITGVRNVLDSIHFSGSNGTTDTAYTATAAIGYCGSQAATASAIHPGNDTAVIGYCAVGNMILGKGLDD